MENEGKSRQNSPDANRVFIVYGRNEKAYNAMQLFIRSLGLSPLGFDEVKNELGGSPFVGDIVESGMRKAKAVVVLFTPDEYAALRPSLKGMSDTPEELARWQSRPNVLFEAGMALMNGPERTVLVTLGDVPLASDMKGRYFFRIGNDSRSTPASSKRRRIISRRSANLAKLHGSRGRFRATCPRRTSQTMPDNFAIAVTSREFGRCCTTKARRPATVWTSGSSPAFSRSASWG